MVEWLRINQIGLLVSQIVLEVSGPPVPVFFALSCSQTSVRGKLAGILNLTLGFHPLGNFRQVECQLKWVLVVFVKPCCELMERNHLLVAPACEAASEIWDFVVEFLVWQTAIVEAERRWVRGRLVEHLTDFFDFCLAQNWV